MKKWFVGIVIAITLGLMSPFCQAHLAHNGGLPCWNGNLNYPFFSMGSHAGSFADVNSAYIYAATNTYTDVNVKTYIAFYTADETMSAGQLTTFRWYKKSNQILISWKADNNFSKPDNSKLVNDTYYLIRMHLGI